MVSSAQLNCYPVGKIAEKAVCRSEFLIPTGLKDNPVVYRQDSS